MREPAQSRLGSRQGGPPVSRFRAYEDEVIALYHARLRGISSPLAADQEVWAQCELQAAGSSVTAPTAWRPA